MKMIFSRGIPLVVTFGMGIWASAASGAPQGYFDLTSGVSLVSGETWIQDGSKYRLYGVQACLRGTFYSVSKAEHLDCGESSIAVFAAYIKDTTPICAPVAKVKDLTYVSCYATVKQVRLDLGNLLITTGWAFASLDEKGAPYQMQYLVTEQTAKDRHAGLWQFPDVQHPSLILSTEARKRVQP